MSERIWMRYLTDQDKQHLSSLPDVPEVGRGERPALLLIDNYRAALGERPLELMEAIQDYPAATGLQGWAALEVQRRLLNAMRDKSLPVVHVTAMYPDSNGVPGWWHSLHGVVENASSHNKHYEIVEAVAPVPGEIVLRKTAPSAFFGTPLQSVLNQMGVDTLIVCGESTSGCVRASVQDAASLRIRTTVVEDGVYDRHEAAHAMNLFDMSQKFADILHSDLVLSYISSLDGLKLSFLKGTHSDH